MSNVAIICNDDPKLPDQEHHMWAPKWNCEILHRWTISKSPDVQYCDHTNYNWMSHKRHRWYSTWSRGTFHFDVLHVSSGHDTQVYMLMIRKSVPVRLWLWHHRMENVNRCCDSQWLQSTAQKKQTIHWLNISIIITLHSPHRIKWYLKWIKKHKKRTPCGMLSNWSFPYLLNISTSVAWETTAYVQQFKVVPNIFSKIKQFTRYLDRFRINGWIATTRADMKTDTNHLYTMGKSETTNHWH